MTFIEGQKCALLPTGSSSRHDLEAITFVSFQMKSKQASLVGQMRYKAADGTRSRVGPQAVGQRVLFAQLLKLNRIPDLGEPSRPVAKRRKLEAPRAESPVSSQEEGGAEASSEEACPADAAGASQDAGSNSDEGAVEEDTAAAGKRAETGRNRESRMKRDRADESAVEEDTAAAGKRVR